MAELNAPWILAVPVVVALGLLWSRPTHRGVAVALEVVAERGGVGSRRRLGRLPPILRGGAVAALAWLAASPFRTVPVEGRSSEGVAVVLALDVSESMSEAGLGGRRKLDVALAELDRFVARRGGDAVGLVTFGGEAVLRVPPSVERTALVRALETLEAGELGEGTAVGTAIGLAANRLRAIEARSRVVVLVTDGHSNAGSLDPVTAARAAAGVGQRVYVVEVRGEDEGATVLPRVAEAGNGRHFSVDDAVAMEAAYREIDTLEPSRLPGATTTARLPASQGLLWWALGLLLVERVVRGTRIGAIP